MIFTLYKNSSSILYQDNQLGCKAVYRRYDGWLLPLRLCLFFNLQIR